MTTKAQLLNYSTAFNAVLDAVFAPPLVRKALTISAHCDRELEVHAHLSRQAGTALRALDVGDIPIDNLSYSDAAAAIRKAFPDSTEHGKCASLLEGLGAELESEATLPEPVSYDEISALNLTAKQIKACGPLVKV